jgi:hypothetical protein
VQFNNNLNLLTLCKMCESNYKRGTETLKMKKTRTIRVKTQVTFKSNI